MSVDVHAVRNAIRRWRREEERLALAIGAEVTKLAEPYFWDTQWVKGDRPLRAWVFTTRSGREGFGQASSRKLRHGKEFESYGGITEDGVINAVYVGMSTTGWECVPVEDALLILADVKGIIRRKEAAKVRVARPVVKTKRGAEAVPVEVTWR